MSVFLLIIGGMLGLDAAWAVGCVPLARHVPGRRWWIALNLIFVGLQLAGLLTIMFSRRLRVEWDRRLPTAALSAVLLWHLLGLGVAVLGAAAALVWGLLRLCFAGRGAPVAAPVSQGGGLSRGQFAAMAALAAPSAFTILTTAISQAQLRRFRVRRFTLAIDGLPRDLEGMTIAHVSDMHLGRLTTGPVLRRMVDTVNGLKTDLVALTGDLINHELSDLPEGLKLAEALHGRYGSCMIEGNHDLFEGRSAFESRARASAVPFLVNQSTTIAIRGHPVQLLGLRWDGDVPGENRDQVIGRSTRALLEQRRPEAFPILLAHHPHAFDTAAAMGIPLTLAGHTHGGQIMLTPNVGVGPMLYRYWSGHYRKSASQLIVSNGVGNWFPLRIEAPAEIVHITLRQA